MMTAPGDLSGCLIKRVYKVVMSLYRCTPAVPVLAVISSGFSCSGFKDETPVTPAPRETTKFTESTRGEPGSPTIDFRANLVTGALSPEHPLNRPDWEQRFAQYRDQGYNAIVWLVSSEVWGGEHKLIRWREFSGALVLSDANNEKCIEKFRWLQAKASQNGLGSYLYTTLVYFTPAFARAHSLDRELPVSETITPSHNVVVRDGNQFCGVRSELTHNYVESMIAELVSTYDDLARFCGPAGPGPGHGASGAVQRSSQIVGSASWDRTRCSPSGVAPACIRIHFVSGRPAGRRHRVFGRPARQSSD